MGLNMLPFSACFVQPWADPGGLCAASEESATWGILPEGAFTKALQRPLRPLCCACARVVLFWL